MTSERTLAFAHPEARAAATEPSGSFDRISLRDLVLEAEIGAFQPERGRTQRLRFNVVVEVRPARDLGDDVDRILSYDKITEAIHAELARERVNLLETLAERIAARILAEPPALRCFVRVEKLDLGPGALGVEIERRQPSDAPNPADAAEPPLAPVLVHLSNAAIGSAGLGGWLDAFQAAGKAAVFTVGRPDGPVPETGIAEPDRRIALLAMEQNAWRLAARDKRCIVVDTRTELEWAAGKGRTSVWAPTKMVLDTAGAPEGTVDAWELATWLAAVLGAEEILRVGFPASARPAAGIPVRDLPADASDLL